MGPIHRDTDQHQGAPPVYEYGAERSNHTSSTDEEVPLLQQTGSIQDQASGGDIDGARMSQEGKMASTGMAPTFHWLMLAALVILVVLDTAVGQVLFYYYTEQYSNFLNQATGAMYIIASSIQRLLLTYMCPPAKSKDDETNPYQNPDIRRPPVPMLVLFCIGFLNGTGNFFQSIGQVHTAGGTAALLGMIGIPLVMLLSWVWLRKQPNTIALFGAFLIFVSTVVATLPTFTNSGVSAGGVTQLWYSVLIYLLGQLFFALEKVYEEFSFSKYSKLEVIKMFQWTMIVQTLLYFAYYPIQTAPAFGEINLHDLPYILRDGLLCTAGQPGISNTAPKCNWINPTLFFLYCAVDYSTYMLQLYVIQKGGANLVVLASAISLPLVNFAFLIHADIDGFNQPFQFENVISLVLALVGFYIFEVYGKTENRR